MGGGDQLSFTDAMGGAKCATEILQRSKLQPTDFARRLAEIPVPTAMVVNAAAMVHYYFDSFIWRVSEKTTQEGLT